MRRSVVFMVVAVAAGFGAAAWRLGAQRESVERQALASYRAGRYAEAVPLLKRWAATPRVRNDRERLKVALAYIADAEVRAAAEKAGEAGGGGAGGPGPLPTAAALAQAEAVVMAKDAAAAPDFGQRVPHRTPAAGEVLTMTIKDLGNFPFNPETDTEVPADVAALAHDYATAGSGLVLTNTFGAHPYASPDVAGADWLRLNRLGAALAREGAGPSARVGGAMGPVWHPDRIATRAAADASRTRDRRGRRAHQADGELAHEELVVGRRLGLVSDLHALDVRRRGGGRSCSIKLLRW